MAPLTPRARTSSDCATGSDCAPVTDALALQAHRRPSLASDVYAASAAYGRGGEQHHSRQFSATAHAYGHPQPFPAPAQDAVRSGPQLLSPKKPRRLSPAAQTGQPLQLQTRRGSAVRVQPQLLAPAALAYAPATSAYAPAASAYAPASSASSDSMGAIQAVGLAGMRLKRVRDTEPAPSSSSSSLQQQQLNPVKPNLVQPNLVSPNPAQPTQAWLSTQRVYKVALHRLLTLESFYPSDAAMLNAFRAQGDFSSAQIEAHGAALLSWARSWLRYSRNAMLRSTLDNKARAPLPQLAEALQHDLHSEVDFTTPANLRRCALLRLIYFQWQALNKLGTKSQSMYRDYEARLREIDALPTPADQEREWRAIVDEEQTRRLEIIREARAKGEPSSGSPSRNLISAAALNPLPPPTPSRSQISAAANPPPLPPAPAPAPPAPGPSFYRFQQQPPLPYHGPPLPPPSQLHRHHHRQPQSPPPPPPPPLQLSRQHGYHTYHHQHPQHLQFHEGASGAHASAGFDNDSEMSVHMSPEP
ncbi:hypothetical protein EV174_002707 [Coemansia sp. RSA 2320]|nr:hypothetical protein EV174_002707 [Coemansia sp. RSA 2320]